MNFILSIKMANLFFYLVDLRGAAAVETTSPAGSARAPVFQTGRRRLPVVASGACEAFQGLGKISSFSTYRLKISAGFAGVFSPGRLPAGAL